MTRALLLRSTSLSAYSHTSIGLIIACRSSQVPFVALVPVVMKTSVQKFGQEVEEESFLEHLKRLEALCQPIFSAVLLSSALLLPRLGEASGLVAKTVVLFVCVMVCWLELF